MIKIERRAGARAIRVRLARLVAHLELEWSCARLPRLRHLLALDATLNRDYLHGAVELMGIRLSGIIAVYPKGQP